MNNLNKIIKEADMQRAQLKSGRIDINRLDKLLSDIEKLGIKSEKRDRNERMKKQLAMFKSPKLKSK